MFVEIGADVSKTLNVNMSIFYFPPISRFGVFDGIETLLKSGEMVVFLEERIECFIKSSNGLLERAIIKIRRFLFELWNFAFDKVEAPCPVLDLVFKAIIIKIAMNSEHLLSFGDLAFLWENSEFQVDHLDF